MNKKRLIIGVEGVALTEKVRYKKHYATKDF